MSSTKILRHIRSLSININTDTTVSLPGTAILKALARSRTLMTNKNKTTTLTGLNRISCSNKTGKDFTNYVRAGLLRLSLVSTTLINLVRTLEIRFGQDFTDCLVGASLINYGR